MDIPIFTRNQNAEQVPLDGSALGISATNVQEAIEYLIENGTGGGGSTVVTTSGPMRIEQITLSEAQATACQVVLGLYPSDPSHVALDIVGGITQLNGVDFTVTGKTLSWSLSELNGLLATGDIIRVIYSSVPDYKIYHVELTQTMINTAEFILPTRAYLPDQVLFDVIGGVAQANGLDFTCDGLKISWSGTQLESLLEIGDHIRVAFLG